jgi:RecG-like helicase
VVDTKIKKLYGVGEARAAAYARLGVSTVGDLLRHYPRGYEDRGDIRLRGGSGKAAFQGVRIDHLFVLPSL